MPAQDFANQLSRRGRGAAADRRRRGAAGRTASSTTAGRCRTCSCCGSATPDNSCSKAPASDRHADRGSRRPASRPAPAPLLDGEVTALEKEHDGDGHVHRGPRARPVAPADPRPAGRRVYQNMTRRDVGHESRPARPGSGRAGRRRRRRCSDAHVARATSATGSSCSGWPPTSGAEVAVMDGKLEFRRRRTPRGAPGARRRADETRSS